MREEKRALGMGMAVAIVMFLVGAYLSMATYWSSQPNSKLPVVPMVAGDDDEGSEEPEEKSEEDKDEKSEPEDEVSEPSQPTPRSGSSKRTGQTTTRLTQELSETRETKGVGSEVSETSEWNMTKPAEAMYKDADKTVAKLRKEAGEARKHIYEKSRDNVNIAPALAALVIAEGKINEVQDAFLSTPQRQEDARRLAKEARREIQLAEGKVLHDLEEMGKDIGKVGKRLAQAKGKIGVLTSLGGDTAVYQKMHDEYTAEYDRIKAVIDQGGEGLMTGLDDLSNMERQVKRLKSMVESAIYALGGTVDDEFDSDHEDDAEDVREAIRDLAASDEDDDSLDVVEKIVDVYVNETKVTAKKARQLQDRSAFAKALLGYRNSDLAELKQSIVANQTRIAAILELISRIEDQAIRDLLMDEVATLEVDNTRLENYLSAVSNEVGFLGWLNRLFGR